MSTSAGVQIGSVTRQKVLGTAPIEDALTASNPLSSAFLRGHRGRCPAV